MPRTLRQLVRDRAGGRCDYCRLPDFAAPRTPTAAISNSRVQHLDGQRWLKGSIVQAATDQNGCYTVDDRHFITNVNATVVQQLGLDWLMINARTIASS